MKSDPDQFDKETDCFAMNERNDHKWNSKSSIQPTWYQMDFWNKPTLNGNENDQHTIPGNGSASSSVCNHSGSQFSSGEHHFTTTESNEKFSEQTGLKPICESNLTSIYLPPALSLSSSVTIKNGYNGITVARKHPGAFQVVHVCNDHGLGTESHSFPKQGPAQVNVYENLNNIAAGSDGFKEDVTLECSPLFLTASVAAMTKSSNGNVESRSRDSVSSDPELYTKDSPTASKLTAQFNKLKAEMVSDFEANFSSIKQLLT